MLIKLLRTYLRPYRRPILYVVVLQLVSTIAMLYLPSLNADIINNGVITGDTGYIMRYGGIMLGVSLAQLVASIIAVYFGARTAMAAGSDIRGGIFAKVQSFSAREVGQFGAPSLITRTTNDVQQVQMLALMTFTLMVMAPIMCVGGIIMALKQNVPLSSLLVIVVPLLILLVFLIIRKMRPLFRSMQVRIDKINRIMREQITGIRVIRAFVRDDYERTRFASANEDLRTVGLGTGRYMALMGPTVMMVINVSSVAVLWFGGHLVQSDSMSIGSLTAFLSYLMQILMSVMMATFMFIMLPRAEVCAERIEEVLGTDTSVVLPANPVREMHTSGQLELRDASFQYPGAQEAVLHGVHLVAHPGQTTAIIGSTGAGKTTLLNLIPRLFDATEGEVLVNEVDVRDLDAALLARTVGLVPQKPYLFSGTVASNLRYGNPDATDEELWTALDTAQARGFVEAMPEQLESPIGQGGSNVSGGQRQRLAIARALVRRPAIYIFDDSFSALDVATDARLRAALKAETRQAALIVVSQRVATISAADHIVVLEAGLVAGDGPHEALLASCATYAEIVD
ncbi:MAG TPA: ABC transporter ATP-binding protein, partial [Micromonosporaceae bacterium]